MEEILDRVPSPTASVPKLRPRKKSFFGIFVLVVLIVIASFFVFPGTWGVTFYKLRFPESRYPGLYIGLTSRDIQNPESANGTEYNYFGMSFAVPWSESPQVTDRSGDLGLVQIRFPNNNFITIGDSRSGDVNFLQDFLRGQSQDAVDKEKALFGDKGLASNYDFYAAILAANLNDLSIFSSNQQMARGLYLSTLKLLMMGMTTLIEHDKIYSFRTKNVEGFQWGDPEINIKGIHFDIFDLQGENHHWFSAWGTQGDIDAILNSLEFTSSTQS